MATKEGYKKVIFEIPETLHRDVKIASARRNISMAMWISRALIKYLKEDAQYDKE